MDEIIVKEAYDSQKRTPIKGWKMSDYTHLALEIIQESFPEATEDDFSKVYGLAYLNNELIFETKACSWEYPGCWYGGALRITNDEFVALLVEDGLLFLNGKRPKFSKDNYKDF